MHIGGATRTDSRQSREQTRPPEDLLIDRSDGVERAALKAIELRIPSRTQHSPLASDGALVVSLGRSRVLHFGHDQIVCHLRIKDQKHGQKRQVSIDRYVIISKRGA